MKAIRLKQFPPLYRGDTANEGLFYAETKSGFKVGAVDMRGGAGHATFSISSAWRDVSSAEVGRLWIESQWITAVKQWSKELKLVPPTVPGCGKQKETS